MQKLLAVFKIVAHHELPVPFGGGRTGTQMEHGADMPEIMTGLYFGHEVIPVQVISNMQVSQVVHLVAILQVVDRQDVRVSAQIELLDQVAADEAGAASHDDHG